MENMLLKMARQLNAMDEASLMAFWDKYLQRVQNFDGSREWEEASLVLSLIHAVRSKNQLFNTRWAEMHPAPTALSNAPVQNDAALWRMQTPRTDIAPERPHATIHQFHPL